MERYPVAGEVISFELFGVSFRDAVETIGLPFLCMILPRMLFMQTYTGINTNQIFLFGLVGFVAGLLILWLKPENQRPYEYIHATARYYLTDNEFHKRRDRTDLDLGAHQDVLLSQAEGHDPQTKADEWRKQQ